jgi:hypothetical protein
MEEVFIEQRGGVLGFSSSQAVAVLISSSSPGREKGKGSKKEHEYNKCSTYSDVIFHCAVRLSAKGRVGKTTSKTPPR